MLPALLTHIGLPLLSTLIGESLGAIDTPATKAAAKALQNVKFEKLSAEEIREANRHAEQILALKLKEDSARLAEINASLRAEIASEDIYVRRMRPTFGYLMALSWAAQMLGLAYIIACKPAQAGDVLNAMSSLSAIWAVGLSVLGIYVYKRSEDKKLL